MARGQAALTADDLPEALRWLDRASRVAGGHDLIDLLRAGCLLGLGRADEATPIYADLAARHDLREAWLGLAACQLRQRHGEAARAALGSLLSGHAGPFAPQLNALLHQAGIFTWAWYEAGQIRQTGRRPLVLRDPDGRILAKRPRLPDGAMRLSLSADPDIFPEMLDLGRLRRLEAFVNEDGQGGLIGFAWHPNDPVTIPALTVVGAGGGRRPIALGPPGSAIADAAGRHDRPFAAPRRLALPVSALPGAGPWRILAATGQNIPGSPIDPDLFRDYARAAAALRAGRVPDFAGLRGAPIPAEFQVAMAPPRRHGTAAPGIAVILPVYGAAAVTRACLASVFVHTPPDVRIIVVDDASPDAELAAELDRLAAAGRIALCRHSANQGFPAAVNTGIKRAGGRDVVLLNADTLVAPHWLDRLAAAARAAPDIGTATPFSNDATLLNYPDPEGDNPVPDPPALARLARLAHKANGARCIDIPTGIGFCLFITRACLRATGAFCAEIFAQGYGEENDFCRRASALGFRHVAVPGVFVAHVGGQSFGLARPHLLARNLAWLNRLHPGYDALIAANVAGPDLAAARRRLDVARLDAWLAQRGAIRTALLVTHDVGGGVEAEVRSRAEALRREGYAPVLLRPVLRRPYLEGTGKIRVEIPDIDDDMALPNLIFDYEEEAPALRRLLRRLRPERLDYHHLLGHPNGLLGLPRMLDLRYAVILHDYAWFCPRVTLTTPDGRYCGEPDLAACAACIADHGAMTDDPTPVAALVARSAAFLAAAARLTAPSAATAAAFRRHFPGLAITISPWDDIPAPAPRALRRATSGRPRRVLVLGAIGGEKGYDVLLACARDAEQRNLALHFTVVGHTIDDARLLDTRRVFITGEYRRAELPGLLAAQDADLGFLPATWPETWSFTLSELWRAGLGAAVFDLGAPAERIRAQGGGLVLPLAASAAQINQALLTVARI